MLLVSGAEVDVLQLGDQQVSFRLRSGQVALSLSKDGFAPVRVKVPGNREVRLDAPGRYWLTIDGGVTKLLVRAGEVSVTGVGTARRREGGRGGLHREGGQGEPRRVARLRRHGQSR